MDEPSSIPVGVSRCRLAPRLRPARPRPPGSIGELKAKVEADARALSSDHDTKSTPGEASWRKRAYALLRHVDHPAFDAVALRLGLDPERARIFALMLSATQGDREALERLVVRASSDQHGDVRDIHFFTVGMDAIKHLDQAAAEGRLSSNELDDLRIGTVLYLLDKWGAQKAYADHVKNTNLAMPIASFGMQAIDKYFGLEGDSSNGQTDNWRSSGAAYRERPSDRRPPELAVRDEWQHPSGKQGKHKSRSRRDEYIKKYEEAKQRLADLHRSQGTREEKRKAERDMKHNLEKANETGEAHSISGPTESGALGLGYWSICRRRGDRLPLFADGSRGT